MKNGCSENQEHSLHDSIVFIGDPAFLLLSSTLNWARQCPALALTVACPFMRWGVQEAGVGLGGRSRLWSCTASFRSMFCCLLGLPHVWFQELGRCLSHVCSFFGMHALRLKGWPGNSTWRGCEWTGCDRWAGALTCLYVRCLWCPWGWQWKVQGAGYR